MRSCPSRLVLLAALATTSGATAQTAGQAPAPEVAEVIVTALPFGAPEDALTSNVDVVTRAELDVAAPVGLGDMLAGLPGVRSTFFGPGASRPVVRGLAGPRVQVLTNGVGAIDASALSPDHQVATDPLEARRIEVIRGPATLAYGGSAIGGVVNVIDERVPESPATGGLDLRVLGSLSSVDEGRTLAASAKVGPGPWVLSLDALRRETDDYAVPVPPESRRLAELEGETPEPGDRVENSATELGQSGLGVAYVADRGFLGVSLKRTDSRYGVPGHGHEEAEAAVAIELEQLRVDVRGESRAPIGPFATTRLTLGYADYEHVELEGGEIGTRFLSEGVEGRLEFVQRERDGWNGAVGLQALTRDLDAVGAEAYVPATTAGEVGAFTVQRVDRERWGYEGGLRLDRRTLDSAAGARDFTNVSASAGVFVRPSEPLFLGLSLARTARAPTEAELFASGAHAATRAFERGDAALGSESNLSLEVTLHYAAGPFSADLHLFHAHYHNFIDLRPTGETADDLPVFAYVATQARFTGAEAEADYVLWRDGGRKLRLEGAYDWVRGDTDLGPPARIPPSSATARLAYDGPRLDGRLELRRVAGQDRVAAFELPTDGYSLLNAFLGYRLYTDDSDDGGLTVYLDARNLTDEEAREHVSFLKDLAPLPGRNIRAGLAFRY